MSLVKLTAVNPKPSVEGTQATGRGGSLADRGEVVR